MFMTIKHNFEGNAQPDWAYEFPGWTGPDTMISRTGPAGLSKSGLFLNMLHTNYKLSIVLR